MRFKAQIIFPILLFSSILFSQKGLELGISSGIHIDQFKVLDGGQHIGPQAGGSNSFGLKIRKGINQNISIETGIDYKFMRGDYFSRAFLKSFNYFMIPIQLNGKFSISKKNKIFLAPSIGGYYLTNSLGAQSYSTDGFTDEHRRFRFEKIHRYSLNSTFQGNTFGASGELALEFTVFSKLIFHLGFQYSTAFKDVYINEMEYIREDQDSFTGQISSKHTYRGYNISFYYPIDANQKN